MENNGGKAPIRGERTFESISIALQTENFVTRAKKLGKITRRTAHGQLDSEQIQQLYELAKEQYSEGAATAGTCLLNLIAFAGPSDPLPHPECLYVRHSNSGPVKERVSGIKLSFLKQNGIISSSEAFLMIDLVFMFFENSKNYRVGGIILTDKKLVMTGPYVEAQLRGAQYRLHYEDPDSKWFLPSMDIIDLSGISDVRFVWGHRNKEIQFKFRTEYYKEKTSTLYGPLFFKWEISRRPKLLQGELNVRIRIADVVWSSSTPRDYTRLRQEELCESIKNAVMELGAALT